MEKFSSDETLAEDIRKKLDDHIHQLLEKPAISAEEHRLLADVCVQLEALSKSKEKSSFDSFIWILVMMLLGFGHGGEK